VSQISGATISHTLQIGDEENGFIPYEQYLANLSNQPPPKTGGTYIVQGGGDVVIQDENGAVIRTLVHFLANYCIRKLTIATVFLELEQMPGVAHHKFMK
jgi:hypothetical protein